MREDTFLARKDIKNFWHLIACIHLHLAQFCTDDTSFFSSSLILHLLLSNQFSFFSTSLAHLTISLQAPHFLHVLYRHISFFRCFSNPDTPLLCFFLLSSNLIPRCFPTSHLSFISCYFVIYTHCAKSLLLSKSPEYKRTHTLAHTLTPSLSLCPPHKRQTDTHIHS